MAGSLPLDSRSILSLVRWLDNPENEAVLDGYLVFAATLDEDDGVTLGADDWP